MPWSWRAEGYSRFFCQIYLGHMCFILESLFKAGERICRCWWGGWPQSTRSPARLWSACAQRQWLSWYAERENILSTSKQWICTNFNNKKMFDQRSPQYFQFQLIVIFKKGLILFSKFTWLLLILKTSQKENLTSVLSSSITRLLAPLRPLSCTFHHLCFYPVMYVVFEMVYCVFDTCDGD